MTAGTLERTPKSDRPHTATSPASETSGASRADCPVCGSDSCFSINEQPLDYEYAIAPSRGLSVLHCRQCGSRFLHPRPTKAELISYYPENYHAYHEDHGGVASFLVNMRAKARAKQYFRLVRGRPIRLFDVGAGDCRHFDDLSHYGEFEFAGVELKPSVAETARQRGYDVRQGTLEELDIAPLENRFDLVTMYQLVEHVIDPRLLLAKAARLLKPGGCVLGQLPCMDSFERRLFGRYWAGYHYPRHLQMLTKRGMGKLLTQSGFVETSISSALHLQAGLSLQNLLVGKLGYRPRMVFGKTPIYSLLLLAVGPFCAFEYLCGQGGMMNFCARKPGDSD